MPLLKINVLPSDVRGSISRITKVSAQDTVIVSELSRLGRSIKEVLQIIEELIQVKGCKLILIKQNLHLDPGNQHDMTNKVLLTIFSMVAELKEILFQKEPKKDSEPEKK